jgi:hypothetical protein
VRWAALLLLAATGFAGTPPPDDSEWKSPDGRHRLFIHMDRTFELSDGENVVAKGTLPQYPYEVHVLSREVGAVLFEDYADPTVHDTLAFLGADGKLRFRLKLEEAIPGGSGGIEREDTGAVWWWAAWWVDEQRGKVVLVSRNGTLSEVDLATGKATKPKKEVILTGLALPWARDSALKVAVELQPEGLRDAAEKILAGGGQSAVTDLLAAVAVETSGGKPVPKKLWNKVLEADPNDDAARGAIAFAGTRIGDIDLVVKTALRKDAFAAFAIDALEGRHAVDEIAGLLTNGSFDPTYRPIVVQALGRQAPEKAIDAIDKEMTDAGAVDGGALLTAAIATGAPDLERRLQHHESVLLKILDRETADVSWLAGYFRGRPTSEAVRPLLRSLARHRNDPTLRRQLIAALKPCSGQDFGDSADAWLKGLSGR